MKLSILALYAIANFSISEEQQIAGISIILSIALIVTAVLLYLSITNVYKLRKRRKEFEDL